MPNLDRARECEQAEQQIGHELEGNGGDEQFLAVESVGHRAGKQAEDNERQSFQKTRESQLKCGAGNIVDLIERCDIANLAGKRA